MSTVIHPALRDKVRYFHELIRSIQNTEVVDERTAKMRDTLINSLLDEQANQIATEYLLPVVRQNRKDQQANAIDKELDAILLSTNVNEYLSKNGKVLKTNNKLSTTNRKLKKKAVKVFTDTTRCEKFVVTPKTILQRAADNLKRIKETKKRVSVKPSK